MQTTVSRKGGRINETNYPSSIISLTSEYGICGFTVKSHIWRAVRSAIYSGFQNLCITLNTVILRSILEWQAGQRATTSLQRLGSINQGGVLRLMLHSPTEGGE